MLQEVLPRMFVKVSHIPANYPCFCLNISLFYLAQAQFTSFKQVLAFVCHLLVTNFVEFKQKYGKSSKIVSSIKQIYFIRLAGMESIAKVGFKFFFWSTNIYTYIRECGSTLYVWLARTTPPINTNFRLTFLLTRLQEALYEDLPV